jgi:hypothetical protein
MSFFDGSARVSAVVVGAGAVVSTDIGPADGEHPASASATGSSNAAALARILFTGFSLVSLPIVGRDVPIP